MSALVPLIELSRGGTLECMHLGAVAVCDTQGRVLIHARLRDSAGMSGDVDVIGEYDYLHVWNHERYVAKLLSEPFTEEDARSLADNGT